MPLFYFFQFVCCIFYQQSFYGCFNRRSLNNKTQPNNSSSLCFCKDGCIFTTQLSLHGLLKDTLRRLLGSTQLASSKFRHPSSIGQKITTAARCLAEDIGKEMLRKLIQTAL